MKLCAYVPGWLFQGLTLFVFFDYNTHPMRFDNPNRSLGLNEFAAGNNI